MDPMGILWMVIIGGIAGWLASILMKTNAQMGLLMNILVGIVGGVLGGYLLPKLGIFPAGTLGLLLAATGGAVLVILVLKLLRVLR